MTGTTHPQAAAYDTWAEVVVLLEEAADYGYRDSATDPALHSLMTWRRRPAGISSARSSALIPSRTVWRVAD